MTTMPASYDSWKLASPSDYWPAICEDCGCADCQCDAPEDEIEDEDECRFECDECGGRPCGCDYLYEQAKERRMYGDD